MTTRTIRPTRLVLSSLVACAVVLGATLAVAAPASAATLSRPVTSVAFGDTSLTVAWHQVAGATSYQVEYSTKRSFAGSVTRSAGTKTHLLVGGLKNGTRYYARVIAHAGSKKVVGAPLAASPDDGYPRALQVTAIPAGPDAIRVSWTGQGRATKVGVLAGSDSTVTQHAFHSAWLPATTTSVVLTVPAEYRSTIGAGTGNPVFVKVATYNSTTASSSMPTTRSMAKSYRLTLAGTHALAGATAPSGARLRVAEWNVNSVGSTSGYPGYAWRDRRLKVAAGIEKSGAAIVATAELSTGNAGLGNGTHQWEDLRDLLAEPRYGGYAIANQVTASTKQGNSSATVGAHLFYLPDVVTRLDGGFVSPQRLLGSSWPASMTDRYFSWAEFRINATGEIFYAVAVHLPVQSEKGSYPKLRTIEAAAIDDYITARAGSRPILLMGDLNSTFADGANAAASMLVGRGYFDTTATAHRSGAQYSTANISRQIDNAAVPGYPTRPYAYKYLAPRIDYILVKNAAGSYRYGNQVLLTDGRFTSTYHGSDHNLQWAEVGIP